jgi:hypothetical protein
MSRAMTKDGRQNTRPRTLAEAHESLAEFWPGSGAGPAVLAEYHRHASETYSAVAKVDKERPNETNWWAQESCRLVEHYTIQANLLASQHESE